MLFIRKIFEPTWNEIEDFLYIPNEFSASPEMDKIEINAPYIFCEEKPIIFFQNKFFYRHIKEIIEKWATKMKVLRKKAVVFIDISRFDRRPSKNIMLRGLADLIIEHDNGNLLFIVVTGNENRRKRVNSLLHMGLRKSGGAIQKPMFAALPAQLQGYRNCPEMNSLEMLEEIKSKTRIDLERAHGPMPESASKVSNDGSPDIEAFLNVVDRARKKNPEWGNNHYLEKTSDREHSGYFEEDESTTYADGGTIQRGSLRKKFKRGS